MDQLNWETGKIHGWTNEQANGLCDGLSQKLYRVVRRTTDLFEGKFDETDFAREIFFLARFDEILEEDEEKALFDQLVSGRPGQSETLEECGEN